MDTFGIPHVFGPVLVPTRYTFFGDQTVMANHFRAGLGLFVNTPRLRQAARRILSEVISKLVTLFKGVTEESIRYGLGCMVSAMFSTPIVEIHGAVIYEHFFKAGFRLDADNYCRRAIQQLLVLDKGSVPHVEARFDFSVASLLNYAHKSSQIMALKYTWDHGIRAEIPSKSSEGEVLLRFAYNYVWTSMRKYNGHALFTGSYLPFILPNVEASFKKLGILVLEGILVFEFNGDNVRENALLFNVVSAIIPRGGEVRLSGVLNNSYQVCYGAPAMDLLTAGAHQGAFFTERLVNPFFASRYVTQGVKVTLVVQKQAFFTAASQSKTLTASLTEKSSVSIQSWYQKIVSEIRIAEERAAKRFMPDNSSGFSKGALKEPDYF
jgi:hypothetical protein